MKKTFSTIAMLATASAALSSVACSGSDDTPGVVAPVGGTGTGGTAATGGGAGTATGGAGTATGGGGSTEPAAGVPLFDGTGTWVDGSGNTAGIQGAFFVLEDSMKDGVAVSDGLGHTDLTPDAFDEMTAKPCVSGTVIQVTDSAGMSGCDATVGETDPMGCQWGAQWGGGIGLNLNETGGEMSVKSTFDATAGGVAGFAFTTSGDPGGTVRFKAKMEGSDADFCAQVNGTSGSFLFSDLKHNCYPGGTPTETLDPSKLVQLEWQIVSSHEASYNVADFCIESVSFLQ